jgi:protein O-GlcNAc transferase
MDIEKELQTAFDQAQQGNMKQAADTYGKILAVQPDNFVIYNKLANVLQDMRNLDGAIACYKKAIELNPHFAEAYYNLGDAYYEQGLVGEAIKCYQLAIRIRPAFADAYNNLGLALKEQKKLHEAAENFRKALQINRNSFRALSNLGNVLSEQGNLDESETCYRAALGINPQLPLVYSNLLLCMDYNSSYDAKTIFQEHLRFAERYEKPLSSTIHHINDRNPSRRIRIGYVSPDFNKHAVAYFIEPVLKLHSHKEFEIFCYSDVMASDEVTIRIQALTDQWRNIVGISDETAAAIIRNDKIDILVDLAGHTANNRMLVLARKPAPVQVTWLGYPATTGLSAIDYKIVDCYTDQPGKTDRYYSESLIRLPETLLCYLPDKKSAAVGELPLLQTGNITFGSCNKLNKISPEVFKMWANILQTIPNSRLLMKAQTLSDKPIQQYITDKFTQQGISEKRIKLFPWTLTTREHLTIYNKIDIGLDAFPYHGTTTTCEALWMGVPVITLEGEAYASRGGVSLLSNVGHRELIAQTADEYVELAVGLANDMTRLQSIRQSLRGEMARSPLCDAERFILHLENCYREMWKSWCDAQ